MSASPGSAVATNATDLPDAVVDAAPAVSGTVALMLQAVAGPSEFSPLAQPAVGRDFVGAVADQRREHLLYIVPRHVEACFAIRAFVEHG